MNNFKYQDSPNLQSSGYQQDFQTGSSFPGSPNYRSFPVSPNHQQVTFNLPSEYVDKNSNIWQQSVQKYQRALYTLDNHDCKNEIADDPQPITDNPLTAKKQTPRTAFEFSTKCSNRIQFKVIGTTVIIMHPTRSRRTVKNYQWKRTLFKMIVTTMTNIHPT